MSERENILIVRDDRLGDAILALPVVQYVNEEFPHARVIFWSSEYVSPIMKFFAGVDQVVSFSDKSAFEIATRLRELKLDRAYCLFPTFKTALGLKLAGIPMRIGTSRRWYSMLFNQRVNISRQGDQRHEADLNLILAGYSETSQRGSFPAINLPDEVKLDVDKILAENGVASGSKRIIIHPGSGGSAREWSPQSFRELAMMLHDATGASVIITGAASEIDKCDAVAGKDFVNLCGKTNLVKLAAVLERADLFVGASTGPLHLAVALGCKVVGLYPPVRNCLPQRWGPYGHPEWVLVPDLKLCETCVPGKITDCACMEELTASIVYKKCLDVLEP